MKQTIGNISPDRTQPLGFTLVEILVVITIIVVLISLLIPTGARLIGKGQEGACANNLRQIGVGLQCYANDHGGDLVPAAVVQDNYYWFDALNPYMGYPQYGDTYAFPPQVSVTSTFPLKWQQCPGKRIRNAPREAVGYGWNYLNFGMDYISAPYLGYGSKMLQATSPSRTIIVGDSKDINPSQPDNQYGYQHRYLYPPTVMGGDLSQSARRHSGHGLYLMLDGHVEALTVNQLMDTNLWTKEKP